MKIKDKERMIDKDYNKRKPLITFRSNLNKSILKFLYKLKRKNKCSMWISEAIKEKYAREN